jgi:hypothetical protein
MVEIKNVRYSEPYCEGDIKLNKYSQISPVVSSITYKGLLPIEYGGMVYSSSGLISQDLSLPSNLETLNTSSKCAEGNDVDSENSSFRRTIAPAEFDRFEETSVKNRWPIKNMQLDIRLSAAECKMVFADVNPKASLDVKQQSSFETYARSPSTFSDMVADSPVSSKELTVDPHVTASFENSIKGYIHKVGPRKVSKSGDCHYFNFFVQTGPDTLRRGVSFSPEKHHDYLDKVMRSHAAVVIKNVKFSKPNKQGDIKIDDFSEIDEGSCDFPYDEHQDMDLISSLSLSSSSSLPVKQDIDTSGCSASSFSKHGVSDTSLDSYHYPSDIHKMERSQSLPQKNTDPMSKRTSLPNIDVFSDGGDHTSVTGYIHDMGPTKRSKKGTCSYFDFCVQTGPDTYRRGITFCSDKHRKSLEQFLEDSTPVCLRNIHFSKSNGMGDIELNKHSEIHPGHCNFSSKTMSSGSTLCADSLRFK